MPPNNNFFGGYGVPTQQQMPMASPMQRNNEVLAVPVNGEIGAQNYPVAAGNTVLLTDFNGERLWIKSNDPNGMFVNMRTFEVKEITPKPIQPADNGNFVSKEEFQKYCQGVDNQLQRVIDYLTNGGANRNESNANVSKSAAVVPAGQ